MDASKGLQLSQENVKVKSSLEHGNMPAAPGSPAESEACLQGIVIVNVRKHTPSTAGRQPCIDIHVPVLLTMHTSIVSGTFVSATHLKDLNGRLVDGDQHCPPVASHIAHSLTRMH
jgi:hypothetical protein